jgi:hypothetical protein
MEAEGEGAPSPVAAAVGAAERNKNKKEEEGEGRQQHAKDQAELGILNPSGRTAADPLMARRAGAAAAIGGKGQCVCVFVCVCVCGRVCSSGSGFGVAYLPVNVCSWLAWGLWVEPTVYNRTPAVLCDLTDDHLPPVPPPL